MTPSDHTPPATDDARSARLDRDGLFVWPDLVAHPVIDEHLDAYQTWLADNEPPPNTTPRTPELRARQLAHIVATYRWHAASPTAQRLFWNSALLSFLTNHFGTEPVMRAPQTGITHRGADLHTDASDWIDPPGSELRAWIALEDIDPAAGPVFFVPGTHHSIVATLYEHALDDRPDLVALLESADWDGWDQLTAPPAAAVFAHTTDTAKHLVAERRLPRAVPTLAKGDAVIFRTDLLHGTMPCADPSRTRKHALVFFADPGARRHNSATYYGPHYDKRTPTNHLDWPIERTPHGLRYRDWPPDLHQRFPAPTGR